ncbi:MAG TPA: DUF3168 domain-containing protein [Lentisphaeria bacterium]|nr:DUF3168 domain-containing protein [Lentisphaeria bacterium]
MMEADLNTLLKAVCPRTFPDVAPSGTARPFMTWQALGGESLRFVDNTAPDKRNTYMQVSVYSTTRAESLSLIRSAEAALCAHPTLIVKPQGEPISTYEDDTQLYGAIQRFSIWAAR